MFLSNCKVMLKIKTLQAEEEGCRPSVEQTVKKLLTGRSDQSSLISLVAITFR